MAGFKLNRFRSQTYAPRTHPMPVPELSDLFEDGTPSVWVVRGLTGEEVARSREASTGLKTLEAALEAIASARKSEKVEGIKELLGFGSEVPEDLAKRLQQLADGSVDPDITHSDAVKLFRDFPIVGYRLTNKILELTGQGSMPGKLDSSTKTPESEGS